jgi:hypothetical protein
MTFFKVYVSLTIVKYFVFIWTTFDKIYKAFNKFSNKIDSGCFVLTAFGKPILILPCRPRWLKQVATFAVLGPPAIWRETFKVLRRIQGKLFWGAQVSFWRKKTRLSGTSAKRRLPKATLARSKPERERDSFVAWWQKLCSAPSFMSCASLANVSL